MTSPRHHGRLAVLTTGALALLLSTGSARSAEPQPAPPYPTPPPRIYVPPPPYYPPPPPPLPVPPPPLSPVIRVIYAPFYAAGLVLRYGVYYGIVAPLEVFSRTLAYGVEGGVDRRGEQDSK
jgi:hypothetical protein